MFQNTPYSQPTLVSVVVITEVKQYAYHIERKNFDQWEEARVKANDAEIIRVKRFARMYAGWTGLSDNLLHNNVYGYFFADQTTIVFIVLNVTESKRSVALYIVNDAADTNTISVRHPTSQDPQCFY